METGSLKLTFVSPSGQTVPPVAPQSCNYALQRRIYYSITQIISRVGLTYSVKISQEGNVDVFLYSEPSEPGWESFSRQEKPPHQVNGQHF